jgi:GrpB-like predicted nucleotidyltransferase (UPF0157 family)
MDKVIEILPYNPQWKNDFITERNRIAKVLGDYAMRIEHNGSTSVPNLSAKPIIDIQVSVPKINPVELYIDKLKQLGYVHVLHPDDSFAPFFHKPAEWPHIYHLHIVEYGGVEERKTLAFRDYLREHPNMAQEYEKLKKEIALKHKGTDFVSQQAYAEAKTEFITKITNLAIKEGYPHK